MSGRVNGSHTVLTAMSAFAMGLIEADRGLTLPRTHKLRELAGSGRGTGSPS
jgi:hypothetical protein